MSKFELTQNCPSHLPCTRFRESGSFYCLRWEKMDKYKANKCKEHKLCPSRLDTRGPAGTKVTAPRRCSLTASGWMGRGAPSSCSCAQLLCVSSHQRWSLGAAVTLQGLFGGRLSGQLESRIPWCSLGPAWEVQCCVLAQDPLCSRAG